MKKILIPTDFSEQAHFAMNIACQIAKVNNAELDVIHILDLAGYIDYSTVGSSYSLMGNPVGVGFDEKIVESLHENAKKKMEEFTAQYDCVGRNVKSIIEFGGIYQTLNQFTKENKVDLIIMGSKGVSGIDEVLVGTNTEKIVRHARCPVLTIKSNIDISDIKDIAFASNFEKEDSAVTDDLKKLQEVFKAKLHLVRVNTPNNFETTRHAKKMMQRFVEENELSNYTFNIYDDVVEEDGIIYFAEDQNVDMIALATHGRSGLMHLLSGSIAEDVVNHAKRPVWTFRLKHK